MFPYFFGPITFLHRLRHTQVHNIKSPTLNIYQYFICFCQVAQEVLYAFLGESQYVYSYLVWVQKRFDLDLFDEWTFGLLKLMGHVNYYIPSQHSSYTDNISKDHNVGHINTLAIDTSFYMHFWLSHNKYLYIWSVLGNPLLISCLGSGASESNQP